MNLKTKYEGMITIADYAYPVECRLFARAIESDESRKFTGPYPLHEVATALLISGKKREDYPRVGNELPEHNPLCDARYAARLFQIALKK